MEQHTSARTHAIPPGFDLAVTCGPAAWVGERSPRHRWKNNTLTWVGRAAETTVWRKVSQPATHTLCIEGTAPEDSWFLNAVLGLDTTMPEFSDSTMQKLAIRYPGLRPMSDGGVFEGLITAIIGQSISVAAAAVTQMKLCVLFGGGIELDNRMFYALPTLEQLADATPALVRESGVTTKRAEAIVHAAQAFADGTWPDDAYARSHAEETVRKLLELPGVGRWTAESTLLWGVGAPNAHPTNDVALLRAARRTYNQPEMTLKELDVLAENWQPARAIAARLLWTDLLGPAPISEAPELQH